MDTVALVFFISIFVFNTSLYLSRISVLCCFGRIGAYIRKETEILFRMKSIYNLVIIHFVFQIKEGYYSFMYKLKLETCWLQHNFYCLHFIIKLLVPEVLTNLKIVHISRGCRYSKIGSYNC